MKKSAVNNEKLHLILGILIIIGLAIGGFYTVYILFQSGQLLIKSLAGGSGTVTSAIVAGSATILVSVFSIVGGNYYEKKLQIESDLREKKIEMYNEFLTFIFELLNYKKIHGTDMPEKEMIEFFNEFTKDIILWGSDDVLKQWYRYRNMLQDGAVKNDNVTNLLEFEKLLLSIRKDTGHKNKGIKSGNIIKLFVNDFKEQEI